MKLLSSYFSAYFYKSAFYLQVLAAYKKLSSTAIAENDLIKADAVEAAYNSILMKQFGARMRGETVGGANVSKDLKFADRYRAFPWAPRSAIRILLFEFNAFSQHFNSKLVLVIVVLSKKSIF